MNSNPKWFHEWMQLTGNKLYARKLGGIVLELVKQGIELVKHYCNAIKPCERQLYK